LSPFLTVEEAYAIGTTFKKQSEMVTLALGPVPVVGEDDSYPKDVKGNAVTPVKFVIRAEKCPNRRGVEAVLRKLQGEVVPFEAVVAGASSLACLYFIGGYPDANAINAAIPAGWKAPSLTIVQDFFLSRLTEQATFVVPATSAFEKDGTFVNHSGLAQTFPRSVRPPVEAKSEAQLAYEILGRSGLASATAARKELAKQLPEFAALNVEQPTRRGQRLELVTV
ncbi:MAG: molybdopterin-dependent oxidoreductase, partial [Gemmataceae bacterium]